MTFIALIEQLHEANSLEVVNLVEISKNTENTYVLRSWITPATAKKTKIIQKTTKADHFHDPHRADDETGSMGGKKLRKVVRNSRYPRQHSKKTSNILVPIFLMALLRHNCPR